MNGLEGGVKSCKWRSINKIGTQSLSAKQTDWIKFFYNGTSRRGQDTINDITDLRERVTFTTAQ